MKNPAFAALILAASAATSSAFGAAPIIKVGTTIYDRNENVVGKIQSVKGDAAVIDTGSAKITLGLSSFMSWPKGPSISMTRSELEAAAAKVQQSGDEEVRLQLTPGANVYDSSGAIAATVDSVQGNDVIINVGKHKAKLPVSAFSKSEKGARIDSTAAELEAAIEKQAPPPTETNTPLPQPPKK
jgi:preprotein translocase subunit YajC